MHAESTHLRFIFSASRNEISFRSNGVADILANDDSEGCDPLMYINE